MINWIYKLLGKTVCDYCGGRGRGICDYTLEGGDDDSVEWGGKGVWACWDCMEDGKVFPPEILKKCMPLIYKNYLFRRKRLNRFKMTFYYYFEELLYKIIYFSPVDKLIYFLGLNSNQVFDFFTKYSPLKSNKIVFL